MSVSLTVDQFARIGNGARRLEELAGSHEREMDRLLTSAEADVELALAALSRARDGTQACVDHLATALRSQLHRSEDGVATARQLCVAARANRLTASRLASTLRGRRDGGRSLQPPAVRHAVLVVDDYEDGRELMSIVLHNAGFIVRTASNGLEAIIAAYELRPAVIVMDVKMPVLDGLEATRLIKAIDAIRDARVIAYTATPPKYGGLGDSLFAAVLEKPAPPDVVVATVRQCANA